MRAVQAGKEGCFRSCENARIIKIASLRSRVGDMHGHHNSLPVSLYLRNGNVNTVIRFRVTRYTRGGV